MIKTDKGEIETEWKTPAGKLTTKYEVEPAEIRICTFDEAVCYYNAATPGSTGTSENFSVTSGKAAPATQDKTIWHLDMFSKSISSDGKTYT
jgi:hypothetical protein